MRPIWYLQTFLKKVCSLSILYTGNTRSDINSWIDIGVMFGNSDIYFQCLIFNWKQLYLFLLMLHNLYLGKNPERE
jgi:hypothetical protein